MLDNTNFIYNSNNLRESNSEITLLQRIQRLQPKPILCAYQNRTKSLQIIKIENIVNFYWEKVVFPYQTILFNTVKQARLKIYSSKNAAAVLTDTISCSRLQVSDSRS